MEKIKKVDGDLGVTLPKGSKVIEFQYNEKFDPSWGIKIEIPMTEKEAIQKVIEKKTKCPSVLSKKPKIIWWKPKSVVFERQISPTGSEQVLFVISIEDEKCYLFIFHTVL